MNTRKFSKIMFGIGLVLVLALTIPFAADYASAWERPKLMVIGAPGLTSTGYVSGTAMLAGITEKTKQQFRMISLEKTSEMAITLKKGVVSLIFMYPAATLQGLEGGFAYKQLGLGPQSLRAVWHGGVLTQGIMTRGDAGIKTMADLKGRKVADYRGDPSYNNYYMDAILAYGNLTWKDVIPTPVGSYGAALRGVIEGSVDGAFSSTPGGITYDLAASKHGIHWIPMPNETPADKEAWARFHKHNSAFFPSIATVGGGVSVDKPIALWGYNYGIIAYDYQDENLVYWFTKQVDEGYDNYKDRHAYLKRWTRDHCLDLSGWYLPWHEGSIRYFKDKGLWTDKMEAKQQELLSKYPQKMTK